MHKFILVLAITSSNAFASSNILPETKSARNPASDSPPQLDQVRVLLFEKTFRRTMQWGNTTSPAPMLETCGNPEKDRRRLTQEYNKFDIIIPPFDQIPPDCFATVSTAASTKHASTMSRIS
ncbi:MAG: hypothetical protein IPL83_08380 [Bdellovibrionales bacterium]|nr:hypothetical protein [Bdellovibrionales bacterium]